MPRKQLVAYAFTFLAALGLGMFLLLPAESELRFLGLIVVIFWLPMALRYLTRLVKERAAVMLQPKASPLLARKTKLANTLDELLFSLIVLGDDRLIERTVLAATVPERAGMWQPAGRF
jgi:hypothetical protein